MGLQLKFKVESIDSEDSKAFAITSAGKRGRRE